MQLRTRSGFPVANPAGMRRHAGARSLAARLLAGCLAMAASAAYAEDYDVLIRGGTVYDGGEGPGRVADVALKGDRIARVGAIPASATATLVVDAKDRTVAPGFIDPYSQAADGLQYIPGKFSETSEVIGLAKVAARYPHAFYISHMRDESAGVLQSLAELTEIARSAQITAVATHLKPLGKGVWGQSAAMIAAIEQARAEGLRVWVDQYPYEANGGALQSMLHRELEPWS